jgi:uncharacterized protein YciI
MFVLVSLSPGPSYGSSARQAAHRAYIAERVAANELLLGGPFVAGSLHGAYVLVVDSLAEAQTLAASDPHVADGVVSASCTEWALVGVNPAVIPPDKLWGSTAQA